MRNIDGKLNCYASLDDKRALPIINGVLREDVVDGKGVRHKINGCGYDIRNVNGKLNGSVYIENDRIVPVIDDVAVDTIADEEGMEYRIMSSVDVENVDGKLNGCIGLEGKDRFSTRVHAPVVDGMMIRQIRDESGKPRLIVNCHNVRNVAGSLTGTVELTDGDNYPVISGKLIQRIGGRPIKIKWDEGFSDAGGAFSGRVILLDTNEEKRVLLGGFLEE